jgi:peptidoglycan/xylan/chitin deacetylase (PgdA/CDA1 family)
VTAPGWALLSFGAGLLALVVFLRFYHRRRYGTVRPEPVVILTYHKVQNRPELGGTWLTVRAFRRQMELVRSSGLPVLHLTDYLDALGRGGDAGRGVVLTFDDGYESVYTGGWPVLRELGLPATVFLVTGYVGRSNEWEQPLARGAFRHLSWDQAREMAADGLVRFESHGVTHRDLTALDDAELEREFRESREAIAGELGRAPEAFSYPFGRFDARVAAALREAGYTYGVAVTARPGWSRRNPLAVARTGMYSTDGVRALAVRLGLRSPERYWAEDLNNRMINRFTLLTASAQRGRRSRYG